jgi:hypothetical protein
VRPWEECCSRSRRRRASGTRCASACCCESQGCWEAVVLPAWDGSTTALAGSEPASAFIGKKCDLGPRQAFIAIRNRQWQSPRRYHKKLLSSPGCDGRKKEDSIRPAASEEAFLFVEQAGKASGPVVRGPGARGIRVHSVEIDLADTASSAACREARLPCGRAKP